MKIELWSYLNNWYWFSLNYDLCLNYLQIFFFSVMFVSNASALYGEAGAGLVCFGLVCWDFLLRWSTSKVLPAGSTLSSLSALCIILPRKQWKLSNLILPLQSDAYISSSLKISPPSPFSQTPTAHLPSPDSYLCTLLELLPATLPNTRQ